jgi:hypothetical protein
MSQVPPRQRRVRPGGAGDPRLQIREKQLDRQVRDLLKDLGLSEFSFHPPDGVRRKPGESDEDHRRVQGRYRAGFPDWVIAGPNGLLFRELKRQDGSLTAQQKAWLARLELLGMDVGVWRPSDLLSGRIARELIAISALRRKAA